MRKKRLVFLGVVLSITALFFAFVPVASAQTATKALVSGQSINRYIGDDEVTVTDDSAGDLVVAGGQVVVKGNVAGELIIAGGVVQIDGNVGGNVLAAGGAVVINGNITGSVRAAGGQVYLNSKTVGGDLVVTGGRIGIAHGAVIGGQQIIKTGNLSSDATNNPKDIVQFVGMNNVNDIGLGRNSLTKRWQLTSKSPVLLVLGALCNAVLLIGTILSGYILIRLFPTFSEKTLQTMKKETFVSLATGVAVFFAAFVGSIALMISIVGWNMLVIVFALGMLAWLFSGVLSQYMVGRMILTWLHKDKTGRLIPLALGMTIIAIVKEILKIIPFVGFVLSVLLSLLMAVWGVGAMALNKLYFLRGRK